MFDVLTNSVEDRARNLLGTFFRHQGRDPAVGLDWLGLIRVATGNQRSLDLTPYPLQHVVENGPTELVGEPLLDLFKTWPNMMPIPFMEAITGDVLCFRMGRPGAPIFHAGIKSGVDRFIHSPSSQSCRETRLIEWWTRRLAYAYRSI